MHGAPYTDPLHPGKVAVSVGDPDAQALRRDQHPRPGGQRIKPPFRIPGLRQASYGSDPGLQGIRDRRRPDLDLDQDLAYVPLVFENYALPAYPDLPLDSKSRAVLEECCAKIFARQREHVDAILDEVFDPQDKTVCVLDRDGK